MGARNKLLLTIATLEIIAVGVLLVWAIGHKDIKTLTPAKPPASTVSMPLVTTTLAATGLSSPTSIVATGQSDDHRLFVTEQSGKIRILKNASHLEPTPFLDISSKVKNDGEMGLLGLAFDPDFAKNNFFYVDYVNQKQETIIARYHASPQTGVAEVGSEKILLDIKQPYANHNGGQLQFGPDGFLYIGMGDGGSAGDPENRAQNKAVLLGKILRIDVDHGDPYQIPADNPFVTDKSAKPEIWAYGLRNPWRFSFDRETGDLYIADVGQNAIEEIDLQKSGSKGGKNYGWRCYEGTTPYNAAGCQDQSHYTAPILTYSHTDKRCSVTGGYVYRGKSAKLKGAYVYADYCGGQIYYAREKSGTWQQTLALQTHYAINTFGQDNSGEIYFSDYAAGSLYQILAN